MCCCLAIPSPFLKGKIRYNSLSVARSSPGPGPLFHRGLQGGKEHPLFTIHVPAGLVINLLQPSRYGVAPGALSPQGWGGRFPLLESTASSPTATPSGCCGGRLNNGCWPASPWRPPGTRGRDCGASVPSFRRPCRRMGKLILSSSVSSSRES